MRGSSICLLLAVSTLLHGANGLSTGPPVQAFFDLVCNRMTPNPSAHGGPAGGNGGYFINISPPMANVSGGFTYEGGQQYTISIVGTTTDSTIRGFLVQARVPGNDPPDAPMLLGTFQTGAGNQGILDCDMAGASMATIGHTARQGDSRSVEFSWTAPMDMGTVNGTVNSTVNGTANNTVNFYYTVVRQQTTHFDALSASEEGAFQAGVGIPTDSPITATLPPGNAVAPQRSPNDYRFQISVPDGCSRAQCDIFIGIDTNAGDDGFLDIYLEGTAEGWVAVGFSETSNMFSADVVACNRVGDDITALDTWNVPSPNRGSPSDIIQDVTLFASSFTDGRISCTVAKRITPIPPNQFDLDLNSDLFVIYARRPAVSSDLMAIESHAGGGVQVRSVSGAQVNPAQAVGGVGVNVFEVFHRRRLTQAHGALMIIAWPLLAVTAIFFAAFMRPALPNGEWFQVHRALLISSMIVGTSGFVLIFIALKNQNGLVNVSSNTSLAHIIIGVIVMALHFANPFIAIFRCKPDGQYRWIFNLLHGSLVGLTAEILALINVGLGIAIFSQTSSRFGDTLAPLWLYVSWDVFYLVLIFGAFIIFVISAIISSRKNTQSVDGKKLAPSLAQFLIPTSSKGSYNVPPQGIELETAGADNPAKETEAPKRKPPSNDAYLRWIALGILLFVTSLVTLVLIILIGLPL